MMTVGQAASHFGVWEWQLRRLYQRRLLPQADRFGQWRVIKPEQLPMIERALREAGYLKPQNDDSPARHHTGEAIAV